MLLRHGKAAAVLINPARYEELLEALDELNDIEALGTSGSTQSRPWRLARSLLGLMPISPREQAEPSALATDQRA
jgi:hypothetical protein